MVTSRILFDTAKQKDELWERWKNGQSVLAISRALERRNKTGVQRIVALNGGIAPAPRCRAVAALKLEEREEISRGIAAGRSVRRIARGLKRSPSTISRRFDATTVRRLTVQTGPRGAPGSGRCALSLVAWRSMGSYDGAWRRSLRCNGRQSRSPVG